MNTVWIVEMVDTSCDKARYITWANVFSTEKKARAHMKSLIKEAIEEDGILEKDDLEYSNDNREVSDTNGRMYYKISERTIDEIR